MSKKYDLIVVGGGSAGLSAAIEAKKNGIDSILVLERDKELGGILLQCIHNGFGLQVFNEELTGPEYAERFVDELLEMGIEYKLNAMVISIGEDKVIEYAKEDEGYVTVEAKAIILTMGCYERNIGSLAIPGSRPSGIMTAGTAQKYLNIDGYLVGKDVFILGSGDIGLIMARRMVLEGANVIGVAEINPYSGGLARNIVQCLEDYDIPLYLSHTVTKIVGDERIEKIVLSEVDTSYQPIPGTDIEIELDTLLLSIGLIPENGLSEGVGIKLHPRTKGPIVDESYQTNIDGVFCSGNVLHVHDLVDFVTKESRKAGISAARYIKGELTKSDTYIETEALNGVSYIVPSLVNADNLESDLELYMRVTNVYKNVKFVIKGDDEVIKEINKRHLMPAEMESIKIKKDDIKKEYKKITVEVVE